MTQRRTRCRHKADNKNWLACSPLNINSTVLSYRLSSKKNDIKKFVPAPLYVYSKIGQRTFKSHSESWQNHQILPLTTSFPTSHPSTLASHLHMGHARAIAKIGRCPFAGTARAAAATPPPLQCVIMHLESAVSPVMNSALSTSFNTADLNNADDTLKKQTASKQKFPDFSCALSIDNQLSLATNLTGGRMSRTMFLELFLHRISSSKMLRPTWTLLSRKFKSLNIFWATCKGRRGTQVMLVKRWISMKPLWSH